jgi:hypothetical protein
LFLADSRVFCDIKATVRVVVTGFFFLFSCSYNLISGVASNPFLRPSPNIPPRQVTPLPTPKPPQKINPNLSKEVEFRGYFIYRGEPHFCIFNKKSNHGEWIKLNEKTYEEFQAHSFDLEKESVTLRFNGQDIVLTLEKSKVDSSNPSGQSSPIIPPPSTKSFSSNSKSSSSVPAVMPPRPSVRPKLPDWLLDARTTSNPPAASNFNSKSSSSSSSFPILPPRRAPNHTSGGSSQAKVSGISVQPAETQRGSLISSPSSIVSVSSNIPSDNGVDVSEIVSTQTNEITTEKDMENLPPPPPPPNILPPGPPPNIVPSER